MEHEDNNNTDAFSPSNMYNIKIKPSGVEMVGYSLAVNIGKRPVKIAKGTPTNLYV
jgi:hypothetical protein